MNGNHVKSRAGSGGKESIGWGLFVSICAFIFFCPPVYGEVLEPALFPSLVSALNIREPLSLFDEPVPLKSREVKERLEREMLLSLWNRPQIILWLKRSRRYLPIIEKLLKKNGMPEDLKYVAVAESALQPHVGSPKGAVGYWQFMAETGRRYGLRIDERIDERRNIHASTGAAIRYFQELHGIFNSWTLAAAAFNMGEHGLKAEILLQGVQDYYRLYLPLETQRYVFRILSVKLIFSDPERYGLKIGEGDYYPGLSGERVKVACLQELPVRLVAEAAKTDFKVIKDLNPEIRGYFLAPGDYDILIPEGRARDFHAHLGRLERSYGEAKERQVYVVQKGDNLTAIAERYEIPLPLLIIQNRLDPGRPIHPGDRLIISPPVPEDEER
ncbi:MAG: transglycosylase SLT domain-containing protein [Desulfatiglandales bacterium]